ncbi:MAG: VWA domain-containing protein [Pseudomonadota bacterium]
MLDAGTQALADLPYIQPSEFENPAWTRALKAAAIISAPSFAGTAITLNAGPGPVRDAWLDLVASLVAPNRKLSRLPGQLSPARLEKSLDLEASLIAGHPVFEAGLFTRNANDILVVPMAERLPPTLVGKLAQALDDGKAPTLIFLCEADPQEDGVPTALAERSVLSLNLHQVSVRDAAFVPPADETTLKSDQVVVSENIMDAGATALAQFHVTSARKLYALLKIVRALAALEDNAVADPTHLMCALELVLGMALNPEAKEQENDEAQDAEPEPNPEESPPDSNNSEDQNEPLDLAALQEMIVAAKAAEAPAEALAPIKSGSTAARNAAIGKAGANRKNAKRGRPVGLSRRPAFDGQRPDTVATLRQAAPWQQMRARARGNDWHAGQRLIVTRDDFRFKRLNHPTETTVIFAVDASGSTALERLGEAKGCIEILLGRCYVRRDQVALISFRGERAEVLLEPTRSLVRAKKGLQSLPGGGPTPLADALCQSHLLALRARNRGQQPFLVFLTDGRGNIALNGEPDKQAARDEALVAAKRCAADDFQSLIIDIARRPRPAASKLADALNADYCTLPRADAQTMSNLIGRYVELDGGP